MTPNPNAVAEAVAALRARQPGGGYRTPDDIAAEVSRRKWACAPPVGDFEPSNEFLFWQAVQAEVQGPRAI